MDRIRVEGELTVDLPTLNTFDVDAFSSLLGGVFEHSAWIARSAHPGVPFASVDALHATMVAVVLNSGPERQLALLRAHPELARAAPLTDSSATEQGGMGLDRVTGDEAAAFDALNDAYRTKFGFPFIIAVRGQRDRSAIMAAMSARTAHAPEQERAAALAEVAKIARYRLDDLIVPETLSESGRLTVHVLDTARGAPAAGMRLSLFQLSGAARTEIGTWQTNVDGRCDGPLLSGPALRPGSFEIVFDVASWRDSSGIGFYDLIPIRFRVVDPAAHYHIPLLLSPFGYTTYRGS